MQSDLPRSPRNREATNLALARHTAFASLFCSLVSIVTALALDLTFLIPLMAGKNVYNPIREFISYQVDEQSGPIMTGVFLLLAVAAWAYAVAAFLAPARHTNRTNLLATFLFGWGLFVGACFRAVPSAELAAEGFLKGSARMHDVGVGFGFVPAMVAAFLDQRGIVLGRVKGFLLTKVSFWMIVVGAFGTAFSVLFLKDVAGLMQRVYIIGIILWLATEAHELFWMSAEEAHLSKTPLDD